MSDQNTVFTVDSPLGVMHIVIENVESGTASIEGTVTVNRIPHRVEQVSWSRGWDGKIRAGSSYSVRRIDRNEYGDQTTWNCYQKITDVIEAEVEKLAERPDFKHLGRLAVLQGQLRTHEHQISRFKSQIEDLLKNIQAEHNAASLVRERLDELEAQEPEAFLHEAKAGSIRGERDARRDIENLGGTPEGEGWSAIYSLEKEPSERLRLLDRQYPTAHITRHVEYAYLKAYLKTCEQAREAVMQAEREQKLGLVTA